MDPMDKNKLDKLKRVKYTVNKSCGTCKYSKFPEHGDFGECMMHDYRHLKHDELRNMSILVFGVCDDFEFDEERTHHLHAYTLFINK